MDAGRGGRTSVTYGRNIRKRNVMLSRVSGHKEDCLRATSLSVVVQEDELQGQSQGFSECEYAQLPNYRTFDKASELFDEVLGENVNASGAVISSKRKKVKAITELSENGGGLESNNVVKAAVHSYSLQDDCSNDGSEELGCDDMFNLPDSQGSVTASVGLVTLSSPVKPVVDGGSPPTASDLATERAGCEEETCAGSKQGSMRVTLRESAFTCPTVFAVSKPVAVDRSLRQIKKVTDATSDDRSASASRGSLEFTEKVAINHPIKLSRNVLIPTSDFDVPVAQMKCSRVDKKLYTVVHNVKLAHQCHEWGETQEFSDEVDYLLTTLCDGSAANVRYLSLVKLANHCLSPVFRSQLRSSDLLSKIFRVYLRFEDDAIYNLCIACILYMLSRDRLSIPLNGPALNVLLRLMKAEPPTLTDAQEYEDYAERMQSLLLEFGAAPENRGLLHAGGLIEWKLGMATTDQQPMHRGSNLDANQLAADVLMFACSHRTNAASRFELRNLPALELLAERVCEQVGRVVCSADAPVTTFACYRETLKSLQCHLQILEHVTHLDAQNQHRLILFGQCQLLRDGVRLFRLAERLLCVNSNDVCAEMQQLVGDTVIALVKVLCNLSHDNELCCSTLGAETDFLSACVRSVVDVRWQLPQSQIFDFSVLVLGLLINLAEHSAANRRMISAASVQLPGGECAGLQAFTEFFLRHDEMARTLECELGVGCADSESASCTPNVIAARNSSAVNDSVEQPSPTQQELRDLVASALKTAGKHMEDSVVASYAALLIGLLMQEEGAVDEVKLRCPNGTLQPMVDMLQRFLEFMQSTSSCASSGVKSIKQVLETMKKSK